MLEKFLIDIGLSEKEAKVYLALLGVDNYSVVELAKKTDINRTTLYPILERLIKDNLVTEVKTGKKVHYAAEAPERLTTFIQNQKTKLDEQSKLVQDVVPQLKSLHRESGERPIIKYYEGREGILKSVEDYFQYPDEKGGVAYVMYPRDLIEETFSPQELKTAAAARINKGVKNIAIYSYSKKEIPSDTTSDRFQVDQNEYPIKSDISVYGDNVRIHTLGKKLSSIYIKNSDFAETLRTIFKLALNCLKKIEAKK